MIDDARRVTRFLDTVNLLLRFMLELSALAALAYWGVETGSGPSRWLLAIAAPGAMAVAWALFVSPRRAVELPPLARLAVEFTLFGAAALALAATGNHTLALTFVLVAVVSGALNHRWARSRTDSASGRPSFQDPKPTRGGNESPKPRS